ncbi:MAG TPA: hypothetical protein VHV54_00695 [Candidatus Binatia bacterium]|nr:hypothetical protein [Candidatus Binatia bacterium]
MDKKRVGTKPQRITKTSIRTTVLDLLEELTALTKDDTLVIAVMKNIFATHKVRLARTLAPVRLVSRTLP